MEKESQKLTLIINASDRYSKKITLWSETGSIDEIEGDIDIVFEMHNILIRNGLDISDIIEIKSFPGPGSFTGLKIGAVIANVLNWDIKKKNLEQLEYPAYGSEPNIQK